MIGQTLHNRYTVTARIGSGAMGTVYRATDSQTNQEVAIKVISRELALNPAMIERFRREGEALQQLRHPNIVGFVDAFQYDEQYVIVMEHVGGGNLHNLIKQGPLPIDRTRQIALALCDALTRTHRLDIIHRDLKPENILLADDGAPKLTDFGIAKLMSEAARLTGTGTQIGTPYYMCPEAWEGRPLDAQADIWSLGVVIYEMLTGEVPFGGETLVAVMNKVLNAPLPDLKTKRADIPDWLGRIVRRMLTRDKTKRYSTTRQVAVDLELADGAAVSKRREESAYDKRGKSTERRKGISQVAPIVFGGFAVMGLIAAVIWLFNELSLAQAVSQHTATVVMQTNQYATEIANRPTETSGPTPTIDINAASTLQYAATQTFAPFAAATQSSLQTIVALTPTDTPTNTPTITRTRTPIPSRTSIPITSLINLHPTLGCDPASAKAGLIVFIFGAGGGSKDKDVAEAAIGTNTYAVITVDGKPTYPVAFYSKTTMNQFGRTEMEWYGSHWGAATWAQLNLITPGQYKVESVWARADGLAERRGCTLTITN